VSGWRLDQDGDAELNNATIRGDLQSDNYDPGVAGWKLDRDGFAEFEEGLFRGDIVGSNITGSDIIGSTFATAPAGSGEFRILIQQLTNVGALTFFDDQGVQFGAFQGVSSAGFRRVDLTSEANMIIVAQGDLRLASTDWQIEPNGIALFSSVTANFLRSNGNARVVGQLDVEATVRAEGNVQADGAGNFGGTGFFGSTLSVNGNTNLQGSTVDISGDTFFRPTASGQFYRMNQAGTGSQGGEPTLDTTGDLFGFVGISGRRVFRVFAGAFLTSSEGRIKGEVDDADLDDCYAKVRAMDLKRYALNRDRDDYYGAKGEWMLGDRDDFVDRGGPLRKLGIIAEDAPDDVSDEDHKNIDVYAYASLVAGAVKALQLRVEAIEADRGDSRAA